MQGPICCIAVVLTFTLAGSCACRGLVRSAACAAVAIVALLLVAVPSGHEVRNSQTLQLGAAAVGAAFWSRHSAAISSGGPGGGMMMIDPNAGAVLGACRARVAASGCCSGGGLGGSRCGRSARVCADGGRVGIKGATSGRRGGGPVTDAESGAKAHGVRLLGRRAGLGTCHPRCCS